jgi:hypothetical protein
MGHLGTAPLEYPQVLAAVGRYIAKQKMRDVCVMEFERGVIITGAVIYSSGETTGRYVEAKVLSFEELQKLVKEH